MSETITELTNIIMEQAKDKDWGTKRSDINVGEKIALIQSEISESFEAYRKHNLHGLDGMDGELASAVFRIFHLAGIMGFDLEPLIVAKIERNKNRDWSWDLLTKEGGKA